jgi:SPP1 gp7 family putative phage head morphogenesis protein
VLGRINARIREAVIEDDLFGLRDEALVDDVPEEMFDFPTTQRRVRGFLRWLRQQLDNEFLEVVGPDANQFIEAAYVAGIENVHRQLSDLDVAFERTDPDNLLPQAFHRSALQTLFTRTYENLVSVRDDVAQAVRDELVEGFAQGQNPTDIARNITNRVDSIGKHRATLIARSEVMNAHSEGTLSRVEELNQSVENEIRTGHGEWDTAEDARVCPFCRAVNGTEFRVSEMRGTTVLFARDGQTYRLKPPAHPNGRCNIRVIVGGGIDRPLRDRLPASVQQVT